MMPGSRLFRPEGAIVTLGCCSPFQFAGSHFRLERRVETSSSRFVLQGGIFGAIRGCCDQSRRRTSAKGKGFTSASGKSRCFERRPRNAKVRAV
jgi:hypothetical protein